VPHLKVSGKGGKTRYLPLHPGTHGLIDDYLDAHTQLYGRRHDEMILDEVQKIGDLTWSSRRSIDRDGPLQVKPHIVGNTLTGHNRVPAG
jgi:site-specific recombinase XerD